MIIPFVPTHRSHRRARLVALLAGVVASVVPARAATAQGVVAQTVRYDTAMLSRVHRENTVTFSSPVIVVDPRTKVAAVTLTNHGTEQLVVDLSLHFYRVRTDTAGVLMAPPDTAPNTVSDPHSLVPWVTGLPAQVTVAAGATDTIVLTVTPPASLAPGEYWARLSARAPSVKRLVPTVIAALTTQGPAASLALVQQPTLANLTIDMETATKLVYRQGASSAHLVAATATATWLPAYGVIRVCAPLRNTGTAATYVRARFSVQLPSGKDTLSQPFDFELPNTANEAMTPCFGFVAFALPPGNYTATLAFDSARADIPAGARVPFEAARVTAALVVPPGSTPTGLPQPPAAPPLAANGVPIIELVPEQGTLESQLAREAKIAVAQGKVPLVEIGASWCAPCRVFLQSLGDSSMVDALKNARVIRVDFDRWGASFLGNPRYDFPKSLPSFFTLRPDGAPGTLFDVPARWGGRVQQYGKLDVRTIAPSLKEFIEEEQGRK